MGMATSNASNFVHHTLEPMPLTTGQPTAHSIVTAHTPGSRAQRLHSAKARLLGRPPAAMALWLASILMLVLGQLAPHNKDGVPLHCRPSCRTLLNEPRTQDAA